MILQPLRPVQAVAEAFNGAIHRDLFRWLGKVTNAINWYTHPPKSVITVALTADDIVASFDADGLGLVAGPYDGWQICNGNNGTDDLDGKVVQFSTTESGGGSSASVGAGIFTLQYVPLMRVERSL